MNLLHLAMGSASPKVISMLLDYGFDPTKEDMFGNNPLMISCILGHTANAAYWLKRFPDFDINKKSQVGFALAQAVNFGPRRLELLKILLRHGASTDMRAPLGFKVLWYLCLSEDSDLDCLKFLLKDKKICDSVNYRLRGLSFRWRVIINVAWFLNRTDLTVSSLQTLFKNIFLSYPNLTLDRFLVFFI